MRITVVIGIIVGLLGCGDVMPLTSDAGDAGTVGAGGSGGTSAGGSTGVAGTTGSAGTGGTPCIENSKQDCRDNGIALMTAQYACHDEGYNETLWGACGADGKISSAYYAGLPCPFDVGITNATDWTGPCPDCVDSTIITNGGGSTSAVWRSTPDVIYCCAGNTVQKIARCRP